MKRALDLAGQRFGRLSVISMERGKRGTVAVCRCECGAEVRAFAYNVKNGNTSSCGCLNHESRAARGRIRAPQMGADNRTHGMSKSHTYVCWQEAKKRCHLPTHTRFPEYGGRGIAVCQRWRESFEAFLADMGECPDGLTLERKDNTRGYEPENCVWATREQQAQNRGWNKANPEIVRRIRSRADAGESVAALAEEFQMSESNARLIVARRTWRNVT